MLETFNTIENDEIVAATALFVCSGIRNIASFVFGKDEIDFSSLSGYQLLQLIESFLKCPDIV
jgi:hypothetical protein